MTSKTVSARSNQAGGCTTGFCVRRAAGLAVVVPNIQFVQVNIAARYSAAVIGIAKPDRINLAAHLVVIIDV